MTNLRTMTRRSGAGKIQRVVAAAAIQQDRPESIDQGGSWSLVNFDGKIVMGDGYMQDKIVGIVVFLVVGTLMTGLAAGSEADWAAIAMGSVSSASTWATAITALAVAGMAMGVYTNGGLKGADIKGTILLLIVASIVGNSGPTGWEWLGVAWLVTGGLRT
ncbi:MAG: hypothetical protein HN598_04590 [Planctomycetes bacterium]|nr:hypothetical protein [Planctomycetota bacterium]MBT7639743.1 hypothetical protein [Planctomycetota bacterium]